VLNQAPHHEDIWVWLHTFLTSALDGGEWSTSCLSYFTSRERALGTQWIGSWMGPTASLGMVVRKKESLALPEIKSPLFIPQPSHCADSATWLLWVS